MSTPAKLKGKPKGTKGAIALNKIRKQMANFTRKDRDKLTQIALYFIRTGKWPKNTYIDIKKMRERSKKRAKKKKSLDESKISFFATC